MKIKFTVNSAILALTAVCVVASVGMAFKYYSKSDMKNNADLSIATAYEKNKLEQQKKQEEEKMTKEKQEIHEQEILAKIPGIVFWGGSITAGVGGNGVSITSEIEALEQENEYFIPIVNCGVSGETAKSILTRAGAEKLYVKEFTIPEKSTDVDIELMFEDGTKPSILRQVAGNNNTINPVTINGVQGNISAVSVNNASVKYKYVFRRIKGGDEVKVDDKTEVETSYNGDYDNYVYVVFIDGSEDWKTPDELIELQKKLLASCKSDKYIIISPTTGDKWKNRELENAMTAQWGEHYFNAREYLSFDGVYDAGVSVTNDDFGFMIKGEIPPCIRADGFNLNEEGYKVLAKKLYQKLIDMGYLIK